MTCVKSSESEADTMHSGLREPFNIAHEAFRTHHHQIDEGHHDC
jgi:hypothetical protein